MLVSAPILRDHCHVLACLCRCFFSGDQQLLQRPRNARVEPLCESIDAHWHVSVSVSFLDIIRYCNAHEMAGFIPVFCAGKQIGYTGQSLAAELFVDSGEFLSLSSLGAGVCVVEDCSCAEEQISSAENTGCWIEYRSFRSRCVAGVFSSCRIFGARGIRSLFLRRVWLMPCFLILMRSPQTSKAHALLL